MSQNVSIQTVRETTAGCEPETHIAKQLLTELLLLMVRSFLCPQCQCQCPDEQCRKVPCVVCHEICLYLFMGTIFISSLCSLSLRESAKNTS